MTDAKKIGRRVLASERARTGAERDKPRSPQAAIWAGMVQLAERLTALERRLAKLEERR